MCSNWVKKNSKDLFQQNNSGIINSFQLNYLMQEKDKNKDIFDRLYSSTAHSDKGYMQRVRSSQKRKRMTEIEDVEEWNK